MFREFDKNNNGFVTAEEFTQGIKEYSVNVDAVRFFELSGANE